MSEQAGPSMAALPYPESFVPLVSASDPVRVPTPGRRVKRYNDRGASDVALAIVWPCVFTRTGLNAILGGNCFVDESR